MDLTRTSCYTEYVKKRNVTIALDEEVARWARVKAAEADISVSRLLAIQLEQQMARESGYEEARDRFLSKPGRQLRQPGDPYPARDTLYDR